MIHIDTLEVYKQALEAGNTEEQALFYVKSLNASFDTVVTEPYLRQELSNLENRLKIFFGYLVIGTIIGSLVIPILIKFLGIQ